VATNNKGNNNNNCNKLRHSNHRCCAERRLLDSWVEQARRHGLRPHQYRTWIRRKTGPDLVVWRCRMDGTLGCATPCILCQKELMRYDLRVHCSLGDTWFSGRLDDKGAPACKPTAGQLKLLFGQCPYEYRDAMLQRAAAGKQEGSSSAGQVADGKRPAKADGKRSAKPANDSSQARSAAKHSSTNSRKKR